MAEEPTYGVVYNDCYGGFSLSEEAILRYIELKGDYFFKAARGEHVYKSTGEPFSDRDIPRHDHILLRVVSELGKQANGAHAELRVELVSVGTPYRIDEYDGNETVMTPDAYDWITP